MRCAIAQPCCGSAAIALRMSMSRVPWSRSVGGGIFPSTFDNRMTEPLVECQGEWDEWQRIGRAADRVDEEAADARTSCILRHRGGLCGGTERARLLCSGPGGCRLCLPPEQRPAAG